MSVRRFGHQLLGAPAASHALMLVSSAAVMQVPFLGIAPGRPGPQSGERVELMRVDAEAWVPGATRPALTRPV